MKLLVTQSLEAVSGGTSVHTAHLVTFPNGDVRAMNTAFMLDFSLVPEGLKDRCNLVVAFDENANG